MKKEKITKSKVEKPFHLSEKTAIIILLLLPVVYFLVFAPGLLTGSKMMYGTDWLMGGYPAREIITKDLSQYKSMPLWYNYVFSGLPTVASPFGDAASLYPFIRLIIATHLLWTYIFVFGFMIAGIGMYLCLRSLDISSYAALIGSIAYMFAGNLTSMTLAGHEGRLLAAAFFPLAFFCWNKGIITKKFYWFVFAGGVAGFSLLHGHFQLTYYGLLFALSYLIVQLILNRKQNKTQNSLKLLSYALISVLITLGMYMVNFLPFYGNLAYTVRATADFQNYKWAISYPLPFKEVFELIVPQFSGTPNNYWGGNPLKLHTEYFGIVLLILAMCSLFSKMRERRTLFFLGASIFGTLIALGGQTPFFKLAYLLPGMKRFRGPSMVFYLVAFSVITIGVIGLQALIDYNQQKKSYDQQAKKKFRQSIYAVIFIFAIVLIAFLISKASITDAQKIEAFTKNSSRFWTGLLISILIASICMYLFNRLANHKIKLINFVIILISLILFDQWRVGANFLKTVENPGVYYAPDEVINYFKNDSSIYRVYPLYYERSNDGILDLYYIQNLSGHGPNPLLSYQEFLGAENTVTFQGANLIYPNFLNLLNTKYIISVPLPEDISRYDVRTQAMIVNMRNVVNNPGIQVVFSGRKYLIYKNNNVLPRAFFVTNYEVISDKVQIIERLKDNSFNPQKYVILSESIPELMFNTDSIVGTAKIISYTPNKIILETEQNNNGFLVLSENYHPDWYCKVDGKLTKIYPAYHTLRTVYLQAGKHNVEFYYYSKLYALGRMITVITSIFCIGVIGIVLYKRKKEKEFSTN